jgi:hypothetical protein
VGGYHGTSKLIAPLARQSLLGVAVQLLDVMPVDFFRPGDGASLSHMKVVPSTT